MVLLPVESSKDPHHVCVSVKDQDPPHYHPPRGVRVSVKEVVMSPRTMYVVDGH